MKKRNKKYSPRPIRNPIGRFFVGAFLCTRLHKLLDELVLKGTATYAEDGAAIEIEDGNFMLSADIVQSTMRFIAIYERNQNVNFGIDFLVFETLARQLEEENVSPGISLACYQQIDKIHKAFNAMKPEISMHLMDKFRLQSQEALEEYERRISEIHSPCYENMASL